MNALRNALMVSLFSSTVAIAAPASEVSTRELLNVMQIQQSLESIRTQVDSQMANACQQELKGKKLTAMQEQAMANMKNKMAAVVHGVLVWEKLEPLYMRIYKESFTEEEIAGMLSFFKTPAGQAVVHKFPMLNQKTMVEVQKIISGMTPQMQKIQEEFKTEMKAASK